MFSITQARRVSISRALCLVDGGRENHDGFPRFRFPLLNGLIQLHKKKNGAKLSETFEQQKQQSGTVTPARHNTDFLFKSFEENKNM